MMNIATIRAALVAQKATLAACNATIDTLLAQLDDQKHVPSPVQADKKWLSLTDAAKFTGKKRHVLKRMAMSGQIESKMSPGGGKMYVLV